MSETDIYALAKRVIQKASQKGLTIATAESCTGGGIAKALTSIPGSSVVYKGSLIAYANEIKENLLGISKKIMVKHGAVSEPVASEMAKNCAQTFGVDIAISVTGIAGPGGGSTAKPVGLVLLGLYADDEIKTSEFRFENNGREGIRHQAICEALKQIENAL